MAQRSLEAGDQFGAFVLLQRVEVFQAPQHGGQPVDLGKPEQIPIRLALLETDYQVVAMKAGRVPAVGNPMAVLGCVPLGRLRLPIGRPPASCPSSCRKP